MRQFAEQEIYLPDGPYKGLRFNCDRQPYTRVFLDLIDSQIWNRNAATGPSQTGKTFVCTVTPTLYHLFETKDTVGFGLPSMEMAGDKWRQDLLPAIEASRYRDLLPSTGSGSKGGTVESIQFKHGPTLRFFSGGGSDKKRAGFTCRVLVVTEADGMDQAGDASREADKITQMEARTLSYGDRKRIYLECTVSIPTGRIWQEVTRGTATQLRLPCPKCLEYVHLTRDCLQGWADAADEIEAAANAAVFCPACGEAWTEAELFHANRLAVGIHRGQTIDRNGVIHGSLPRTDTLGFRWDTLNNLFLSPGFVAAKEWKAQRAENEENAEKELRQFFWAIPFEPSAMDSTPLEASAVMARTKPGHNRGIVPEGTDWITVGVDVGQWLCHWTAIAWRKNGDGHVIDYGRQEVPTRELGVEKAIQTALRELRDGVFRDGWKLGTKLATAATTWIDSGFKTDVIYEFCRESGGTYMPSDGLGSSQELRSYAKPKSTGTTVKRIGEGFHIAIIPHRRSYVAEVHADYWKSRIHEGLTTPLDKPGALTLFVAGANEHLSYAKHLTAEKRVEEFVAGKGMVVRWVRERRDNHWLDATYNAAAAGAFCGVKLVRAELPPTMPTSPDDRQAPSRIRDMRFRQR